MLGFSQITALREELQKLLGTDFDEKEFHDRFLSYGPLPLALVRFHLLQWAIPFAGKSF